MCTADDQCQMLPWPGLSADCILVEDPINPGIEQTDELEVCYLLVIPEIDRDDRGIGKSFKGR
jgi:hypothetical protein